MFIVAIAAHLLDNWGYKRCLTHQQIQFQLWFSEARKLGFEIKHLHLNSWENSKCCSHLIKILISSCLHLHYGWNDFLNLSIVQNEIFKKASKRNRFSHFAVLTWHWDGKNVHLKDLWKSITYIHFQSLLLCAPILKIKYIFFGPINNIFI